MITRLVAFGEAPCGCEFKIFEVREPPRRRKDRFLQVNSGGVIPLGWFGSLGRELDAHEKSCPKGGSHATRS